MAIRGLALNWLPCVAYMVAIFALSSRPIGATGVPDTLAHFIEYAPLGFLMSRAVAGGLRLVQPTTAFIAWVLASVYGCTDEIHQMFVPGRVASLKDVMMDALGAGAGATAALVIAGMGRSAAVRQYRGGQR